MCFDRVWDVQLQLHRSGWQRGAHPVSCSRVSTLPPMLMRLTPFIKLPSHECCMPAQSLLLPPAPPWAEFFDFENWLNHNFSRNAFLFSANCRLQGFKKLSRARCPNFTCTRRLARAALSAVRRSTFSLGENPHTLRSLNNHNANLRKYPCSLCIDAKTVS